MKTISIALIIVLTTSGMLFAEQYQKYEGETFSSQNSLGNTDTFKPIEIKPIIVEPQIQFKHNPWNGKWEQAKPQEVPRHNPYENKWEYSKPENPIIYNPWVGEYEFQK